MRVNVDYSGLRDLESDLGKIPPALYREGRRVVQANAVDGRDTARRIAKWTSRKHAKLYPLTITADRSAQAFMGFGGGQMKAGYGPEPRGQGLLASILENGSRNNPGHQNLDQSLDLIRPKFARDVDRMLDGLFWPKS